ncbi:MAG: hypothetical protein HKN84_16205 [Gammaproteobacteria bacterium]|nr:hypothetical protein [Gammaproteobacteria bacterium]
MWLSKPVYESLPYYYMALGFVAVLASVQIERWYWPELFGLCGLLSLVGGLVPWFKRRAYRQSRSPHSIEDQA